jgi:hypothetical protein
LAVLAVCVTGCLSGPDTTTCSSNDDCFQGEACRDGTCAATGFSGDEAPQWPYRECSFNILANPDACGDGTCDPEIGEAQANCGQDCSCGDNLCDLSETEVCLQCQTACNFDSQCDDGEATGLCPDCPACGNSLCELGELDECERDCGQRRSPPMAVFLSAVVAQPSAFFLATENGRSLSHTLAPGDASPAYDVQVGQSIGVRFGRNDGRGGFNNDVPNQPVCFGPVQLVVGTEDSNGILGVTTFDSPPNEIAGARANLRIINASDYLSPIGVGVEDRTPSHFLRFLDAPEWITVPTGNQKIYLVDDKGHETEWQFTAAAGEMIFAVIRAGSFNEQGEPSLEVSFVRMGKL